MVSRKNIILLTVLYCCVKCQASTGKQQVHIYEQNVKTSIERERQDRILVNSWAELLQIKQVNVTSSFRLQMTKHKEHSFRKKNNNKEEVNKKSELNTSPMKPMVNSRQKCCPSLSRSANQLVWKERKKFFRQIINPQWNNCKAVYSDDIKKTEETYYEGETTYLRIANSADRDQKNSIQQLEKEIHKWRKSYRYLKRLCHSRKTMNEEGVESCLTEYMLRDNYGQTLQRLLQIKLEAMLDLHQVMIKAVVDLEECLEILLSNFLGKVRYVMDLLKTCYEIKTGVIN